MSSSGGSSPIGGQSFFKRPDDQQKKASGLERSDSQNLSDIDSAQETQSKAASGRGFEISHPGTSKVSTFSTGPALKLRPELQQAFSDHAKDILNAYPPDDHVYVPLGASGDIITALMNRQASNVTSRCIPISGANAVTEWTPKQLKNLKKYIKEAVGDEAINGSKKLLVMDVTHGGGSLCNVAGWLKEVVGEMRSDPGRVKMLSLNEVVSPSAKVTMPKAGKTPPFSEESMEERLIPSEYLTSGFIPGGTTYVKETVLENEDDMDDDSAPQSPDGDETNSPQANFAVANAPPSDTATLPAAAAFLKRSNTMSSGSSQGPSEGNWKVEYYEKPWDRLIADKTEPKTELFDGLLGQSFKSARQFNKAPISELVEGDRHPSNFYNETGHSEVNEIVDQIMLKK